MVIFTLNMNEFKNQKQKQHLKIIAIIVITYSELILFEKFFWISF